MDTEIPAAITLHDRHIPAEAWKRLTSRRYRAEHPNPGVVILLLRAFGTMTSVGCLAGEEPERQAWARLLSSAAELASHRMACEERVPIVRPDNEANRGVVGHCWWCGLLPAQHTGEPTARNLDLQKPRDPDDVLVLAKRGKIWTLHPIGRAIGSTGDDGTDDEPPPYGLVSADAAGYVVTAWRRAWVLEGYTHPDLDSCDDIRGEIR